MSSCPENWEGHAVDAAVPLSHLIPKDLDDLDAPVFDMSSLERLPWLAEAL